MKAAKLREISYDDLGEKFPRRRENLGVRPNQGNGPIPTRCYVIVKGRWHYRTSPTSIHEGRRDRSAVGHSCRYLAGLIAARKAVATKT